MRLTQFEIFPADFSISIHAPTRGATDDRADDGAAAADFNSRTYTRCDPKMSVTAIRLHGFQFTHLHEVRRFALFCAMSDDTFQFTHLHEVRLSRLIRLLQAPIFQFTHLHEVRPRFFISQRLFKNFNSRTYTRCDSPPSPITSRMPNFNSRTYTRCD